VKRTLVLVAAVALLAGCRSSSPNDLAWATSRMWDRTERDWDQTKENIAGILPGIERSFTDGWREMNYTVDLYTENHLSRAGYTRYERAER
jgi:outer membrane biogenesis lipoprotein LolB